MFWLGTEQGAPCLNTRATARSNINLLGSAWEIVNKPFTTMCDILMKQWCICRQGVADIWHAVPEGSDALLWREQTC